MDLIKKDKLNRSIKDRYDYSFDVSKDGLHLIEIVASAKSWWQNLKGLRSFFKDDDLAVAIDGREFPKLNGKKGLFDGETAWNGNNLRGLSKTAVFVINLKKGNHTLKFSADQKPTLESIAIYKIDNDEAKYIPEENNPAADGDRRQWITVILVDLPLKHLSIKASAKNYSGKRDDDDIKLIIDGKIETNKTDKAHKNWYWCGRVLSGQEKDFSQNLNLENGFHYIELWADRTPQINIIELIIEEKKEEPKKRILTVDDPKWTGDFNDDSDEMLLARLIFGESRNQPEEAMMWVGWSAVNRTKANSWWPDNIHGVILQPDQYDSFKQKDPNYSKLIDPLGYRDVDEPTKKSWFECYAIATSIVENTIKNPTDATHFHGADLTQEWYKKHVVPDGKFIRKIGDISFYWSPN